jgi:tRNA dimethylallyltransferase
MKQRIEVITGPTASGKSALAIKRAEDNPKIEIVNADASLLYKGFDIGTAKPSIDIRSKIPHHIIDILQPNVRFNAADYSKIARDTIRKIIQNGSIPLVVGGTGFYIDALFFGLASLEADEDKLEEARKLVGKEMAEFGFDEMHKRLQVIDPDLYHQIARERNPRRLERAWEYYYATGIALGEARKVKSEPFEHEPTFTVIDVEREDLRNRISIRIDEMLASGWLDEVKHLLKIGVNTEMPAMNAIGYRELAAVIISGKKANEAHEEILIRTRQYAKRQETWMKKYKQS